MEYRILTKEMLTPSICRMKVHAPLIASSARPGQFLMVLADEKGERVPLTISDFDPEEGSVTIVTQRIGASTSDIIAREAGDCFADVVGPLGNASDFVSMPEEELRSQRYIFIAGGVGTAPVYPQAKWLHSRGIPVDVIIGAKTSDLLIYRDRAVAIGPMVMMKFATLTARRLSLPIVVSLNTLMVDGTGMCGACRVTVGGKMKFACVDGPEFDGYEVDFDEAMRRQGQYRSEEAAENEHHKCKIGRDA